MPRGRPTKYTKEATTKILEALREGCTRVAAAACGGVTYQTFNEWTKDFPDFSDAVSIAEGEAEAFFTRRIYREARDPDGEWRAAESFLKRRRSKDWGDKQTTEISGTEGGPIAIRSVEAVLPPDGV